MLGGVVGGRTRHTYPSTAAGRKALRERPPAWQRPVMSVASSRPS